MKAAGLGIYDKEVVLVFSDENVMPTAPTLKNIPDVVHPRLKAAAESQGRSLNSKSIVCQQMASPPTLMPAVERLARVRQLRAALHQGKFSADDINAGKRKDRPRSWIQG